MATGEAGKKESEGKGEGLPQGNKLRIYFVPMGCIKDFLPGLYFLPPLLSYAFALWPSKKCIYVVWHYNF